MSCGNCFGGGCCPTGLSIEGNVLTLTYTDEDGNSQELTVDLVSGVAQVDGMGSGTAFADNGDGTVTLEDSLGNTAVIDICAAISGCDGVQNVTYNSGTRTLTITYFDSTTSAIALGSGGTALFFRDETGGNAPGSPTAPETPPASPESGTKVKEFFDDANRYWTYNGSAWVLDFEEPVIAAGTDGNSFFHDASSGGTVDIPGVPPAAPSGYSGTPVDGDTAIVFYANGALYYERVSGAWILKRQQEYKEDTLTEATGGVSPTNPATWPTAVNHNMIVDPVTGYLLGFVGPDGTPYTIPVCQRDRVELGKLGTVTTEAAVENYSPVADTGNQTIIDAWAELGQAGSGPTTFRVYRYPSGGGAGVLMGTFTIPAGTRKLTLASLEGVVVPAGGSLGSQITTGSDAENLNIVIWLEDCAGVAASAGEQGASVVVVDGVLTWDPGDGGGTDVYDVAQNGEDDLGNVTAVDYSTGKKHKHITLSAGANALTLTGPPSARDVLLAVTQEAGGTGTITWPVNVSFPGAAPQPGATPGSVSVFRFYYRDDSAIFHGDG